MKTRFDYWERRGRKFPPYSTQFTRQQFEGKREPQRDMSNKKPYRTKAQKKMACGVPLPRNPIILRGPAMRKADPQEHAKVMRQHNAAWPDAKPGMLKALRTELAEARRHFPTNENLLTTLVEFSDELQALMKTHDDLVTLIPPPAHCRGATAAAVYSKAMQVAALAFRIAEEGDARHRYGAYLFEGPLFAGNMGNGA